jgi:tetratricopeptide (TPR) repeat protein
MGLISSLEKISLFGGHAKETPSWHHYGIGERIRFLEACQRDARLVKNHLIKARRIKLLCTSLVAAALIVVIALDISPTRDALGEALLDAKAERMRAGKVLDVRDLYGLAYELQADRRYEGAAMAYEFIIMQHPGDEVALNNLAWLYATAEDESVRDKKAALELARRAASIKKEAFILDTLAEAYFINGMHEEALATIEEALALKPEENRNYYLEQRERFRTAEPPE